MSRDPAVFITEQSRSDRERQTSDDVTFTQDLAFMMQTDSLTKQKQTHKQGTKHASKGERRERVIQERGVKRRTCTKWTAKMGTRVSIS